MAESLGRLWSRGAQVGRRQLVRLLERSRLIKPVLYYVELSLTDECNLNCRGCGFYCPIADPWYADAAEHVRDMRQLRRLFRNIRRIRLMGGEPLLHPDVERFLASTRQIWPRTDIRLVTNGLLLCRMGERFWRACRDHAIAIDWTVYPPMAEQMDAVCDYVKARGVAITARKVTRFITHENFKGDSDPAEAFRICRSRYDCPYLRQGKVYVCVYPALAHYLNRRFGTTIPTDGFLDLYAPGVTGRRILKMLGTPCPSCRYCTCGFPEFAWGLSAGEASEWDGGARMHPEGSKPR